MPNYTIISVSSMKSGRLSPFITIMHGVTALRLALAILRKQGHLQCLNGFSHYVGLTMNPCDAPPVGVDCPFLLVHHTLVNHRLVGTQIEDDLTQDLVPIDSDGHHSARDSSHWPAVLHADILPPCLALCSMLAKLLGCIRGGCYHKCGWLWLHCRRLTDKSRSHRRERDAAANATYLCAI